MAKTRIHRMPRKNNFTIIPNKILNNANLTWETRGLISYLISKPDDWCISVGQLIKAGPSSRRVIYRMLKELQNAGYIVKVQENEKGRFGSVVYELYEEPFIQNEQTVNKRNDRLHENRNTVDRCNGIGSTTNIVINNKDITNKEEEKRVIPSEIIKSIESFYEYMVTKYTSRYPNWEDRKSAQIKRDAEVFDKLIRLDGFEKNKIEKVISFAVRDEFWCKNLLHLSSLRNKGKNGAIKFVNILTEYEEGNKSHKYERFANG